MIKWGSRKQDLMGQVASWQISNPVLNYVALLPPKSNDDSLSEYVVAQNGPWHVTEEEFEGLNVKLYVYRRRMIVEIITFNQLAPNGEKQTLDSLIRRSVDHDNVRKVTDLIKRVVKLPSTADVQVIPFLSLDFKVDHRSRENWISDGATSFNLRLFDSVKGRQAVIRASRHIIVLLGGSGRLRQEITNLIFEKILYRSASNKILYRSASNKVADDQVFHFMEGLARYAIPTENNIYLQREFARLGVILGSFQVIIGIWSAVATSLNSALTIGVTTVPLLTFLGCIYLWIRRINLVRWD